MPLSVPRKRIVRRKDRIVRVIQQKQGPKVVSTPRTVYQQDYAQDNEEDQKGVTKIIVSCCGKECGRGRCGGGGGCNGGCNGAICPVYDSLGYPYYPVYNPPLYFPQSPPCYPTLPCNTVAPPIYATSSPLAYPGGFAYPGIVPPPPMLSYPVAPGPICLSNSRVTAPYASNFLPSC
jgi:hypothetical protein